LYLFLSDCGFTCFYLSFKLVWEKLHERMTPYKKMVITAADRGAPVFPRILRAHSARKVERNPFPIAIGAGRHDSRIGRGAVPPFRTGGGGF
jgi:hypothetical protein